MKTNHTHVMLHIDGSSSAEIIYHRTDKLLFEVPVTDGSLATLAQVIRTVNEDGTIEDRHDADHAVRGLLDAAGISPV